jgi:ribosomal 30S subunit maturation factor RimM
LKYFLIARIEQTFGKDGFVRLQSFSDFPERFLSLKKVYLDFWGDKKTFYVEDVKDVKGEVYN